MALLNLIGRSLTNSQFLRHVRYEIIKDFLDFLILSKLKEAPCSGYDIMNHFRKVYGVLLSSGHVYSLLYRLESLGFVSGRSTGKKRIYELTPNGSLLHKMFCENILTIQMFMDRLFTNEFK
ncbi:MAG: PadR family transcriptional regulator [Candidatus Bathyarchaeia archaeon]